MPMPMDESRQQLRDRSSRGGWFELFELFSRKRGDPGVGFHEVDEMLQLLEMPKTCNGVCPS